MNFMSLLNLNTHKNNCEHQKLNIAVEIRHRDIAHLEYQASLNSMPKEQTQRLTPTAPGGYICHETSRSTASRSA